jgi:DNA polymerase-3 subunit epsilon
MRQIVLDTETTGLEVERGHRIIEIGAVELRNRRATGRNFHRYLNPERAIDEGARAVHGISSADLADSPRFAQVAAELIEFISGAELVIHNASFDVGFLEAELQRLPESSGLPRRIADLCGVLDTLALAREIHPGQRNSLDALCKRYGIDNSKRTKHGALMDSLLLASVYVELLGERQATLELAASGQSSGGRSRQRQVAAVRQVPLAPRLTAEDEAAHTAFVEQLGEKAIWKRLAGPSTG